MVQVKSGYHIQRPVLTGESKTRREEATKMYMDFIEGYARSGYSDEIKLCYIRMALANWRSRMAQIDAGEY